MVEECRATKTNDKKGKRKVHDNKHDGSNKKSKLTCWKCGKSGHFKRDCRVGKGENHFKNTNRASGSGEGSKDHNPNKGQNYNYNLNTVQHYVSLISEAFYVQDDDVAWWIDSGASITHACKGRGLFKMFQLVYHGSVLHMENESSAPIVGVDSIVLEFTSGKTISLSNVLYVPKLHKNFVSSSVLNKCGFRQVFESDKYILSKSGVFVGFGYYNNGFRDEVSTLHPYCFNVEDDPKTFDKAMKSHDVAFWKEAVNDEMDSIIGNNTWVLVNLPPGCKPLGYKWIFKKKMKVDGTIEKFNARLVIQGFRQRPGIDYFNIYAPIARISTIRLLIALASIQNLVIHQMDVKTTFLNEDLDKEVYMKQPEGFIMPGNEHKVCKLVKSLYGVKQAPKQWHQIFDEVVLSSGYRLNQSNKCVYIKFDNSGNGVIICLYVDDMLIFGTNQQQVDLRKEFLSSRFSMKDMGEADVILGLGS
ncbi:UNVERIFIED_CONTAM: Retrovirus-related Pol polyprotein from transposon TNT 1-94 [Sesamum radiatum]|uniref:Retrovirus-related Pol polyprotein from transposon TNT 1-94 n=1 Tax=Sesamum radiatum TaxID=300843 RepID=A0AAW2M3U4_SESRA